MKDKIILSGMVFYGYHGVNANEKQFGQTFIVDIELQTVLDRPAKSDDLNDTVDYSKVYARVKAVVEGPSSNLLEKVAVEIADNILQGFPVDGIMVRISKPQVSMGGGVLAGAAVEIHRGKMG